MWRHLAPAAAAAAAEQSRAALGLGLCHCLHLGHAAVWLTNNGHGHGNWPACRAGLSSSLLSFPAPVRPLLPCLSSRRFASPRVLVLCLRYRRRPSTAGSLVRVRVSPFCLLPFGPFRVGKRGWGGRYQPGLAMRRCFKFPTC